MGHDRFLGGKNLPWMMPWFLFWIALILGGRLGRWEMWEGGEVGNVRKVEG